MDPLDCLDLSRQSSSLLSPSVYPQLNSCHDFTENIFPFQVSPTDPATRKGQDRDTRVSVRSQTAKTSHAPLASLTNVQLSTAESSPPKTTLPISEPFTPVAHHPYQEEVRLSTLQVPCTRACNLASSQKVLLPLQVQPAAEQTPAVLSGKSHQSPSRQQKPADPHRESTALFKGFSASTAESGLLEVEEIAEINGSPELVRAPHDNVPAAPPKESTCPAVPATEATLPLKQSPAAAALKQQDTLAQPAERLHHSSQQQRHQLQQQQQDGDAHMMHAGEDISSATTHGVAQQQGLDGSNHMPASELDPGPSSPRLQSLQDASELSHRISAADRPTADAGLAGKPLTGQVCASVSSDLLLHTGCGPNCKAKARFQFSSVSDGCHACHACKASNSCQTCILYPKACTEQVILRSVFLQNKTV